jgi:hypothetical protein
MTDLFRSQTVNQFVRWLAFWIKGADCVWVASKFVYNSTNDSFHTYRGDVFYDGYNDYVIHGSGCLDKGQQVSFLAMDSSTSWFDAFAAMQIYGVTYAQDISRILNNTTYSYNYTNYPELSRLNSFLNDKNQYSLYVQDGPSCSLFPPPVATGYRRNTQAINTINPTPYVIANQFVVNQTSTIPARPCTLTKKKQFADIVVL